MKNTVSSFMTFLTFAFLVASCEWIKDSTKQAINKTGEIVGKTGAEFGDGVYKGIQKTFENKITVSDNLKAQGLEIGEVVISSSNEVTDNVLITYLIFNKDINQEIILKLFNEYGKESGRLIQTVIGKKGSAEHVEFTFDKHVNIDTKGTITIDQFN